MCCKIWTCFSSLAKLQLRIWKSYQTVIHKENYWCHSLRKPVEGKLQKDRDFWAGDSYWSRRSSFWDSGTREHCKLNYELIFITFILWSFPFDMDFFFKKNWIAVVRQKGIQGYSVEAGWFVQEQFCNLHKLQDGEGQQFDWRDSCCWSNHPMIGRDFNVLLGYMGLLFGRIKW